MGSFQFSDLPGILVVILDLYHHDLIVIRVAVLAYNMKRAINVLGVAKIMEQLQSAWEGRLSAPPEHTEPTNYLIGNGDANFGALTANSGSNTKNKASFWGNGIFGNYKALFTRPRPFAEARKLDSSVSFEENSLSRRKSSGLVTKITASINFVLAPCE